MNIWLINHYAVPTEYYPLARPEMFAKNLMAAGHDVTIFAASTVHNSDINLITDDSLYQEQIVDGIHYVLIKASQYQGNGIKRIVNMFQFPLRLPRVCKRFKKPDVILSVSVTPMACMKGIRLAKKYSCKGVAEIADLWPETLVAYGKIGEKNPALRLMYWYEKNLYKKADAIVFTMEGGRDYIVQHGWDLMSGGPIDLKKVHHINNGIDLEEFNKNKKEFQLSDSDLSNPDSFKVVYVGSIRKVNGLDILLPVAEELKRRMQKNIQLLIYGDGDQLAWLKDHVTENGLDDFIKFKGRVDKKYVPFIVSCADINLVHVQSTSIMRFGCSLNKLFDYFASGKPILSDLPVHYDLIKKYQAGLVLDAQTPDAIVQGIRSFMEMTAEQRRQMGENAYRAATDYDYRCLTRQLLDVLESRPA